MLYLCLAYLDDDGDKLLFENLYYAHRDKMYSVARSILCSEHDAEDCVESVFLKIASQYWETVRRIGNSDDLRNYLLKATKNTALNEWGAGHKEKPLDLDEELLSEKDMEYITDTAFFQRIAEKMDYDEALQKLKQMHPRYRDVLYYHWVLDLSMPQTASLLNRSLSATKQQLVRGKKLLLDMIDHGGDGV